MFRWSWLSLVTGLVCALAAGVTAQGADWPCFLADANRSGKTAENLSFPLAPTWRYEPSQGPAPAWPEPGRELHRLDFDYTFQPIIVNDTVYFSSSADDSVRAVGLADGQLQWRYTTGGPIRFAPEFHDGRIYVASDDGYVYCLNAQTGGLHWSFRGGPDGRKMLGNGRMISRWPCRSGVLIRDGVLYFTAGMWPSEGVYVYALDARTGTPIWCNDSSGDMYRNQPHGGASAFTGVCPQGYLLASEDLLLVPSGRTTPAAYDRETGELVYYQPYLYATPYDPEGWANRANGGSWALVAGDLFLSPLHRGGAPDLDAVVGESEPRPGDGLVAYSLDTGLRVIDLEGKHRAIVHNGVLYAAGDGEAVAIDLAKWREMGKLHQDNVRWSKPHGRVYSMALAGDGLLVGGDGTITAFRASSGENLWKHTVGAQVRGIATGSGRLLLATQTGSLVCFESNRIAFPPVAVGEPESWELPVRDRATGLATQAVRKSGVSQGYALVLGETDSSLAAALALQTDLRVINALNGDADLAAARRQLMTTGLYGSRVVVETLNDPASLPYASYFADLVVVASEVKNLSGDELYRVLRPCGGVLCLPKDMRPTGERLIREAKIPGEELRAGDGWTLVVRGPLGSAGEWRYQWADGGRTGIGQQRGVRPPFELLWFGGPGPDRMMPRHWGTSPPLSVAGRVFITGQHHVIAFDAYNGRELWARELKGAGRRFAPYYAANFVADDDCLYVAAGSSCQRLLQSSGKTLTVYAAPDIPGLESAKPEEVAYVDLEWPSTWHVIGPLPKNSAPFPEETLRNVPAEVTVDGKTYAPASVAAVNGFVDFSYPFGGYGFEPLKPGEEPGPYPRGEYKQDEDSLERIAYAFAKISCPTAGKLLIGAGADWWMQWFLDGKPIYDTLAAGNDHHPYTPANHVFSVDAGAGEHVLAVMVKAGSMGWCFVSAGGARYAGQLMGAPVEFRQPFWAYLSVTEGLVLGSLQLTPLGRPSEVGSAVFALDKGDGNLRWVYRARRSVPNRGIAFGDGRLFLLDTTPRAAVESAKRLGTDATPEQTLIAVDLATGEELWRRDDVPPMQYELACADGVVVVGANAGYDARTSDRIWEQPEAAPERIPIIHDDWVIAQPQAYHLHTGEARTTAHLLTGEERVWKFPRAYGCGVVGGCRDMLFFRSGTPGFYVFEEDGTTNFGGVRPGCSMNMIAANGLMIVPESSAGCSCSYSFQTSLALLPAPEHEEPWYVFQGETPLQALKEIHLNLGAPGDRRDAKGTPWLGFPRPTMGAACPVPVAISSRDVQWYHHPAASKTMKETDRPWIYASGVSGARKFTVALDPAAGDIARTYTVRMHFAEPDAAEPGERVFDVRLQDQPVLTDFDIARESRGRLAPMVKEWKGIKAAGSLSFELVARSEAMPVLSGVEIVRETGR